MKDLKLTLIIGMALMVPSCVVVAQNKVDEQGKKQGVWEIKDKKNKSKKVITFKDDFPIDTAYYYNKKGVLELKNIFSNKGTNCHSIFLYPDNKVKAEGDYVNKQKEGTWKYYNKKGKIINEEQYKHNQKNGIEKKFDMDGKNLLEQTTYVEGKKEGQCYKNLFSAGYYIANYKDDKLEGEYKEYRPNKSLKIKGQFSNDKKEGTWEVYDVSDNIIQRLFYKNDLLISDAIRFNLPDGIKEIAQKNIALIRMAGKQTQIYLLNGEKINCHNSVEAIIPLLDANTFVRINEKQNMYINLTIVTGIEANGTVKTKIDFNQKLIADKEGTQALKTLF